MCYYCISKYLPIAYLSIHFFLQKEKKKKPYLHCWNCNVCILPARRTQFTPKRIWAFLLLTYLTIWWFGVSRLLLANGLFFILFERFKHWPIGLLRFLLAPLPVVEGYGYVGLLFLCPLFLDLSFCPDASEYKIHLMLCRISSFHFISFLFYFIFFITIAYHLVLFN